MTAQSTILLVEDEPALRTALTEQCTAEGFKVIPATDGQEAITLLQSQNVDCILLDILMPKKDGFAVLSERERLGKEDIPVVILTNLDAVAAPKNVQAILMKSNVTLHEVVQTIRRVLGTPTGFTLLEMLVVVTIIALLATVVFVALDPLRQFAESRNARRWNDVNSITTAVYRYVIANKAYPPGVDATVRQLGTATTGCGSPCAQAESCLNIASQIAPYLVEIPTDPAAGTEEKTLYTIVRNADNVLTVAACEAENTATIRVSR